MTVFISQHKQRRCSSCNDEQIRCLLVFVSFLLFLSCLVSYLLSLSLSSSFLALVRHVHLHVVFPYKTPARVSPSDRRGLNEPTGSTPRVVQWGDARGRGSSGCLESAVRVIGWSGGKRQRRQRLVVHCTVLSSAYVLSLPSTLSVLSTLSTCLCQISCSHLTG